MGCQGLYLLYVAICNKPASKEIPLLPQSYKVEFKKAMKLQNIYWVAGQNVAQETEQMAQ